MLKLWGFGTVVAPVCIGGCWPQLFHCLAQLKKGCDVGYTDFHLHIMMHNKLES